MGAALQADGEYEVRVYDLKHQGRPDNANFAVIMPARPVNPKLKKQVPS